MHSSALAQLKDHYRRAQGSVNYWNNAARAARKDVHRHTGQRKDNDCLRLANCETKAIEAAKQLEAIKAQLTELDPHGAHARQHNAMRSAINRAQRDIQHFEHLASLPGQNEHTQAQHHTRLAQRRAKLLQLQEALARHNTNINQQVEQRQAQHNDLAIARSICRGIDQHTALLNADAQQPRPVTTTHNRPTPAALVQALNAAIQLAKQHGELTQVHQLQQILAGQLEQLAFKQDLQQPGEPSSP